jgi:hypothetical protein
MENLPVPTSGQIVLLAAPHHFLRNTVPPLLAHIAQDGPLKVLDGGNAFQPNVVARHLRLQVPQVYGQLESIQIARAFTCYQVLALLAETPAEKTTIFGLELMDTFYDENVPVRERRRLLDDCVLHLRRLSLNAAVAVSISLLSTGQSDEWLTRLAPIANRVWRFEDPQQPAQLKLF